MTHRLPFGPIRLPAGGLVEIEPTTRKSDGRVLRRYTVKGLPDVVLTEDPMDTLFAIGEVTPKPMEMPKGGIFYLNYSTEEMFKNLEDLAKKV